MHELFLSLYFDEATEQAVRAVWGKIAAAGVQVDGIEGHRPHITLAAYETERPDAYAPWVEAFAHTQVRLPLRLQSPSIFFETNTVYLAPRLSGAWFEMHTRLLTYLREQGADPQRFAHHIDIGTWTPHCTLVSRVEPQDVLTVVKIAQQAWRIRDGFAEGIGVVVLPETLDRSKHRFASPRTAADYTIRRARLGELEQIQAAEQAAGQRFALVGLEAISAMNPIAHEVLAQHQIKGQLWVAVTAADEIAGFLMMAVVDGEAYIRRAIGTPRPRPSWIRATLANLWLSMGTGAGL
ncbi:MAG: 2'-5' RNA ligase family protein [Anaerolineales bacterium]|nr:2'-5' RNA ligase family protein [Anaerolineales bacterium]